MVYIAALMFGSAALIALGISIWVRPGVPLGRLFWILTLAVVASPLVPLAPLLLSPPDPYGHNAIGLVPVLILFFPFAAGWLFGVLVALIVRSSVPARDKTSTAA